MRRLALACLTLVAGLAAAAAPAPAAYPQDFGPVAGNPADALAHLPIEAFRYDRATHCKSSPAAGAVALESWLERHVRGSSWGIVRCERWGRRSASLHAEGRAVDWHLDAGRRADARAAHSVIALLLAPDRRGRPAALARRMGVQEIIWDCRAWFGGQPALRRYSACRGRRRVDRTTAHRDHIHFGLTRRGALRRTSFWTRRAPAAGDREPAPALERPDAVLEADEVDVDAGVEAGPELDPGLDG